MEWGRKWLVWKKSRHWGWLSLPNWIGILILSLLIKLTPTKLEPWFVLWSFFLLRLLCVSTNLPYGHAWNTVVCAGALSCYLELLDKLQKPICRTVGSSLAASLEPFAHHWNIASLSLFYKYIMFIWPGLTGSGSLFSKEVYLFLFW